MEPMEASKKVISRDEWERRLQTVKVGKADMNKLVMNFLVTKGLAGAVEKFQLESGTNPDIDLATVADRMAVKKAVQIGDVVYAFQKVNNLNPEVLNTNPKALFHLQQQLLIELMRNGKHKEALEVAREKLAPMAMKNGFQEELERNFALLVLNDVTMGPLKDLLSMSQRIKTASHVNEAILISQNNEKEAKLSSLLKMLAWVDKELEQIVTYPKIYDFSTCKPEDPAAI